jgi:predicted nucleotidyltransferase
MENLCMLTTMLPSSSRAYVFGSFLRDTVPRDLDLLIVYDKLFCLPSRAYSLHEVFVAKLQQELQLKVDLTLLTKEEELSSQFAQKTRAVAFHEVFDGSRNSR